MKITVFEGSPTELAEAFPDFFRDSKKILSENSFSEAPKSPRAEINSIPTSAESRVYVSKTIAQDFFRRRPLNEKQRAVFTTVLSGHPAPVPSTILLEKTGYSSSQFAGLMGALGRRLANTDGFVNPMQIFILEWDHVKWCQTYRLPETVREALAEEPWAQ
jgi:hypothetical protein